MEADIGDPAHAFSEASLGSIGVAPHTTIANDPGNDPMSRAYEVVHVVGDNVTSAPDTVAVEEPLQIRLAGVDVAVLMRTPGHDHELAAGYLFSEGTISGLDDIDAIRHCRQDNHGGAPLYANVINVTPARRDIIQPEHWKRHSDGYSSCGVCGKVSIDQVVRCIPPLDEQVQVSSQTLFTIADKMRTAQAAFQQTGGLHAAALFTAQGRLVVLREDVGRHNAVDKVIGYSLLRGELPLASYVLGVTSRASFEIVQKAVLAGICMLAVMSAPSTLAIDLARETGMTLAAFLRPGRYNLYSGQSPIVTSRSAAKLEERL